MSVEMLMKLSFIISKMGISEDLSKIETSTNEELGKAVLALAIGNLYKADNEVYELVAAYKNVNIDEAKKLDIIPMIKELVNSEYIKPFLAQ